MNTFYKKSEARKVCPVISRPDLVAERNAEITTRQGVVDLYAKNRTDSRMISRRPDLSIYSIMSSFRWCELRKQGLLERYLRAERESGVILELSAEGLT